MRNIPIRIVKVTTILIASAMTLLVILTVANLGLTAIERNKYRPPGKMTAIDGKRIHVYSEGTGPNNVVLLSGWGTSCPVLDFRPLIRALSGSFCVIVIEGFGYGWSDWTDVPRTNQNVVEEIRQALKESGVRPPYALVPHSISGYYALYYANRYPDEIEAVIGLDSGVPEQSRLWKPERESFLPGMLRATGLARLALLLKPQMIGEYSPAYPEADKRKIAMMYSWNYGNRTQSDENVHRLENARQLLGVAYPAHIPVSMILSRDAIDFVQKNIPGLDWIKSHQDQMAGNIWGKLYTVAGGHYVHWANTEIIAEIVEKTISRRYENSRVE